MHIIFGHLDAIYSEQTVSRYVIDSTESKDFDLGV